MWATLVIESSFIVDGGFAYLIILFPCWLFEEIRWFAEDRAAWSFYQLESIIILLRLSILSVLVFSNLFVYQISQLLFHTKVLLLFCESIFKVIEVLLLLQTVRLWLITELTRNLLLWEMPQPLVSIIELWILLAFHEVYIWKLAINVWLWLSRLLEDSTLDILTFILLCLAIHTLLSSIGLNNALEIIVAT